MTKTMLDHIIVTSINNVPAMDAHRVIRTGDILEVDPAATPEIGDIVLTFGKAIYERDWFEPYSDLIEKDLIRGVVVAKRVILRR